MNKISINYLFVSFNKETILYILAMLFEYFAEYLYRALLFKELIYSVKNGHDYPAPLISVFEVNRSIHLCF